MTREYELNDHIILTLDDDSEVECEVITIFEANDREYIALCNITEEDERDLYLYRYSEDDEENPILDNIEEDAEYEAVCDAFDKWLDEEDFDEIIEEE